MIDPVTLAALGLGGMFALILMRVPIGVAMAIAGVAGFAALSNLNAALSLLATEPATLMASTDLAVIPLFLLMGSFASASGLSADIYRFAFAFLGHRRGGLALATVGGCAAFGAACGSSVATAATMGRVALPEMLRRGYAPGLATGSIAAGGTLGILIPPSNIMVIYAYLTEQFVITLFVAAVIPSIIAVVFDMIAIQAYVRLHPESAPAGPRMPWRERFVVMRQSWGIVLLLFTIIGGIYGGVFTVQEAAACGAGFTLLFTLLRGRLTLPVLRAVVVETASSTAMIYVILVGASIFSYFIAATKMPDALVGLINGLDVHALVIVFALIVMYLVLGAIFDEVAALLITLPFVFPLILHLGFHPVWWGIVCVMVIEVGLIAPPIGLNVFVIHGMARHIPLATIYRGIMPILAADLARIALVVLFPGIVMWLPTVTGMK
ncbi:MAG: TRAP transporter large permease [Rhodospirillaceae bacterium]